MITTALAVALLTQAAPADDAPAVDAAAPQLPVPWIEAGDQRPLEQQKRQLFSQALVLETRALDAMAALPGASAESVATDRLRLEVIRGLLERPIDPNRIAPQALSLADRYLVRFALDRLRGEAADARALEAWMDANRRFLLDRRPADRGAALTARGETLESLARASVLRRFLVAVETGELNDATRTSLLVELRTAFPDAPLPTTVLATRPGLAGRCDDGKRSVRRSLALPPAAGSQTLPRLDGAERPLGEASTIAELIAGMRGAGGG